MESNTNIEQELLKKSRILALKIFAEAFLLSQGNKKTEELFPDRRIVEGTIISNGEAYVLHHWLVEEYKNMGLSLAKIIEAKGESLEDGKLSNYELKELIRRADMMVIQMSVIKKYINHK